MKDMYLPYLRGKQNELLTLRDFADRHVGNDRIVPIIEPVKSTFNSMSIAVNKLLDCNIKFAMILNPQDGDFKHVTADVLGGLPMLEERGEAWLPTFLYRSGIAEKIIAEIDRNKFRGVMVIYRDDLNLMDEDVQSLLNRDEVMYVVDGNLTRRKIRRIRERYPDKRLIRLDDSFNVQSPSTSYANTPDESFSEAYLDYKEDKLQGFSDYTTLAKDYSEGGMLPAAVVLHLTYEGEDEIRIHHFVSDSNNRMTSIQKKFSEAAFKVAPFFSTMPQTTAIADIGRLFAEERYPGLGYLKKLSVINHLELVDRLLQEE